MKDRTLLIQKVINQLKADYYLEIGINYGINILNVICPRKLGVDPRVRITPRKKIFSYFKNPSNLFNRLYPCTSDKFFENNENFLKKIGLDVVFIDGLHTYDQSLRDVLNTLKFLNDNGIIIMHDVNPISKRSAQFGRLGDTWKTIIHLRSKHNDLKIFVLECETGIGIITKGKPKNTLKLDPSEIKKLTYEDLRRNRKEYLNLRDSDYFFKFLKSLRSNTQITLFSKILYDFILKTLFRFKPLLYLYKTIP